jgi:hypothetical protein
MYRHGVLHAFQHLPRAIPISTRHGDRQDSLVNRFLAVDLIDGNVKVTAQLPKHGMQPPLLLTTRRALAKPELESEDGDVHLTENSGRVVSERINGRSAFRPLMTAG